VLDYKFLYLLFLPFLAYLTTILQLQGLYSVKGKKAYELQNRSKLKDTVGASNLKMKK
jgi:hypothetical protein